MESHNSKLNKQTLIYIITTSVILLIALFAYLFFKQNNNDNPSPKITNTDSIDHKKDSLKLNIESDSSIITNTDYEGEEGESFGKVVYVGKGQVLGNKQIKFGEVLFVDYQKSSENKKFVYLENPYEKKNLSAYNVGPDDLLDEYIFEKYRKNFSLAPFSTLPNPVKDLILDNDYNNGDKYNITQNADRAKSTICYGDFDNDGIKDIAILMDNNEKQISRLLIICTNSVTKKPYIGFAENYNDKILINSFKAGALIVINSELQASEVDGIILKGEDLKIAIAYDKKLQKYKTYFQE